MTLLTSRQNPKIKQIRLMQKRKYRQEKGLLVVEGIRHVGEAVEANGDTLISTTTNAGQQGLELRFNGSNALEFFLGASGILCFLHFLRIPLSPSWN